MLVVGGGILSTDPLEGWVLVFWVRLGFGFGLGLGLCVGLGFRLGVGFGLGLCLGVVLRPWSWIQGHGMLKPCMYAYTFVPPFLPVCLYVILYP